MWKNVLIVDFGREFGIWFGWGRWWKDDFIMRCVDLYYGFDIDKYVLKDVFV